MECKSAIQSMGFTGISKSEQIYEMINWFNLKQKKLDGIIFEKSIVRVLFGCEGTYWNVVLNLSQLVCKNKLS